MQKQKAVSKQKKKNRGKIEILASIMKLCTMGQKKKTHIMYNANLSGKQNSRYLYELTKKGLLLQCISYEDDDDGCIVYRTTEKGREYLDNYYRMMELIEEEKVLGENDRHEEEEEETREEEHLSLQIRNHIQGSSFSFH